MLKFLFELLTDPLGLPLAWHWELLAMAVIGCVAFAVGWEVSPGGEFGSLIHWIVRFGTFVVLWAIVYVVIIAAQWVAANWIVVVAVLATLVVTLCATLYYRRRRRQKAKIAQEAEKESGEKL